MKFGRPMLQLTVNDSVLAAKALRGSVMVWAAEAKYASVTELRDITAELIRFAPDSTRLLVLLEPSVMQTRALTKLPPVGRTALRALVANNAGQFFRRNGVALVTDAMWVGSGVDRVAITVAADEPLLNAIAQGARDAGLPVEGIAPTGRASLDLLPPCERAVRHRIGRRRLVVVTIAVAGLWMTALGLYAFRLTAERSAIEQELTVAQQPLAALRELRQEMGVAQMMIDTLAQAQRARGSALATLARITGALPDSAVLTSYRWSSGDSGEVVGSGASATAVRAAIARHHPLLNPRVDSTITTAAFAIDVGLHRHE